MEFEHYSKERTGKGCWYKTYTRECVLCGSGETWRERRWDEKPEDPMQRYDLEQYACDCHFI